MNRKYYIDYFFLSQFPRIFYAVGSKSLNLKEVFLREILFYIVGVRDIDRLKFCSYWWDTLFRVEKEYVVSNRQLAIDNFRKCVRTKK